MGAWGTAIFSNDISLDIRHEFRDHLGDGIPVAQVIDNLIKEYSPDNDPDIKADFWLALAATQWRHGRLEERTKRKALDIIESGEDLLRWDDIKTKQKRKIVLEKLKSQLQSQPPLPKKVPKRYIAANDWQIGEVVGLKLQTSGKWVLLRTIGHHTDRGGRCAICEILDWEGETIPSSSKIKSLQIRFGGYNYSTSQFMLGEPHTTKPNTRIKLTGVISTPQQQPHRYTVVPWKFSDNFLQSTFELE